MFVIVCYTIGNQDAASEVAGRPPPQALARAAGPAGSITISIFTTTTNNTIMCLSLLLLLLILQ